MTVHPSLIVRFGICRTSWNPQLLPDMTADVLFPLAFKSFGWLNRNFHKYFYIYLAKCQIELTVCRNGWRRDSMQIYSCWDEHLHWQYSTYCIWKSLRQYANMAASMQIWLPICKCCCQCANSDATVQTWLTCWINCMTVSMQILLSMCKFGCQYANMTASMQIWMLVCILL